MIKSTAKKAASKANKEDLRDAGIGAAGAVVTELTVGLDTVIGVFV